MNKSDAFESFIGIIKSLIDDNSLIIIGALIIAGISPEHREIVLAGLLGFMAKKAPAP